MTSKRTPARSASGDTARPAAPHPLPQTGGAYVVTPAGLIPETPPAATADDAKEA